ncbi:hypothetical protein NM208_g11006 [Fusarium decemcellulare]|uniref:Uncharacterized protein n=1 Tax=Fusarium decemcellulare TaxID=57161 RepID=A0ACC1RWA4_9HYPO|nr:hypothetical protein NM208_g11006 [Fusarium decemcellulare]
MSQFVFLITGASGGLGGPIALEALRRGHKVIATSRDSSKLGNLQAAGAAVMSLNVTDDDETLGAKLNEAHAVYGRITHVINCAGYLLAGAVEEASSREVAETFATNVFGVTNISRASIPYLRESASTSNGKPVVLAHFGSSTGWSPAPTLGHYCATKMAVTVLTESMALELAPMGVSACAIDAGAFRTGFLSTSSGDGQSIEHRQHALRRLPDLYAKEGTPAKFVNDAMNASDGTQPGNPIKAAEVLVNVLTGTGVAAGTGVPTRLVLGSDCVAAIRGRMEAVGKNLSEWEHVSKLTDFVN